MNSQIKLSWFVSIKCFHEKCNEGNTLDKNLLREEFDDEFEMFFVTCSKDIKCARHI